MPKVYFSIVIICCFLWTNAQVAVRNEPRHHNVFENDYIRILDVIIAPHDTTQFHIHSTPSVFITLSKTVTGSQLINQQPAKGTSTPGNCWYDSLVTPRIHRVWNEDTSWFHTIDIELIGGKSRNDQTPLQDPSVQLFFNEPLVNGYHVNLQPGGSIKLPVSTSGYLLLSTGNDNVEYKMNGHSSSRKMKTGHFFWIDAGENFSMTSSEKTSANFLLLQLK